MTREHRRRHHLKRATRLYEKWERLSFDVVAPPEQERRAFAKQDAS